ncbi:MAG: lactate racemase domain-containing protein [Pseudomonadota bacterium]
MIPPVIPIPLPGGLEMALPKFVRARQRFNGDTVEDVAGAVAAEFKKFAHIDLTGKTVAVTVGSRGIRSQKPVVVAVIDELQKAGAEPFIVPAMGSHGGGTAEGQKKIVEDYEMGEDQMGVPIKSSMEVVELAEVVDGLKVYCDRNAFEADYIVPLNRVKPHTSFRGKWESGVCKMIAIGLGKHTGAVEMHRRGMPRFPELLPPMTEAFLAKTNVLFGVAIVENGYERLHTVNLIPPEQIIERDAELLELSKSLIPRLLIDNIDVLVVDEIGKNISGSGMDPNVTGRNAAKGNDFGGPEIQQIIVRGLTEETHGNATGLGSADIATQSFVRGMDWTKTYVNLVTAGVPGRGSLPFIANNDREALFIAMRGCPMLDGETSRLVRIENTLDLGEIWVSEAMSVDVTAHPDMELLGEPFEMSFDSDGQMVPFHGADVMAAG